MCHSTANKKIKSFAAAHWDAQKSARPYLGVMDKNYEEYITSVYVRIY